MTLTPNLGGDSTTWYIASMQPVRPLYIADWIAISLLVCSMALVAHLRSDPRVGKLLPIFSSQSQWLNCDGRDHLGAEYDSIAQAIRNGNGFSDPFGVMSGPTAWMPPVIPYFLATLYWLFDDNRHSVVATVVTIQALVVLMTAAIVISEARRQRVVIIGYVSICVGLTANFHQLFQMTHDVWLHLLIVNLMWIGLVHRWNRVRGIVWWGVLGGFAALSAPILGGVWALLTTYRWTMSKNARHQDAAKRLDALISLACVALLSMTMVVPWTVRNHREFDRWLPIKSNGMFELWQSQCLDDDGVLDQKTTASHPWPSDGVLRKEYLQLGEIGFVDQYATLVRTAIAADPWNFCTRVGRRFRAATLWYQSHDRDENLVWPTRFLRVVFPLPIVAVLLLIVGGNWKGRRIATVLAVYSCVLLPYVLVSYYDRYAAPLVGIKMMVVVYACRCKPFGSGPCSTSVVRNKRTR